ncbi:hypothetical protein [Hyphococcus luteus]|uniref:Uncharacterized protein n=1 Tax=Hyphococcus luteus TaxID=2058213 RepID=A0A2S7K2J5_9PROT|nr:hypothetical protein [Marinicaulis flavus]PQA86668.1 hypothetical protein CW354_14315 [Marinicaulis flavus]
MLWLAVHMWALLLAAFGVGLGAGWWIWGQRNRPPAPSETGDAPLGTLDLDDDAGAGAPDRS